MSDFDAPSHEASCKKLNSKEFYSEWAEIVEFHAMTMGDVYQLTTDVGTDRVS